MELEILTSVDSINVAVIVKWNSEKEELFP